MPADKRAKITFLSPPTTTDSMGAPTGSWTTFKSGIWASKEPIIGNQYFAAQAQQSDVKVKFCCAWFSGVLNTMRIQHGTDIWQILDAIDPKDYHREWVCYCKKVS